MDKLKKVQLLKYAVIVGSLMYAGDTLDIGKRSSDIYESSRARVSDMITKDIGERSDSYLSNLIKATDSAEYGHEISRVAVASIDSLADDQKIEVFQQALENSNEYVRDCVLTVSAEVASYNAKAEMVNGHIPELNPSDSQLAFLNSGNNLFGNDVNGAYSLLQLKDDLGDKYTRLKGDLIDKLEQFRGE